MKRPLGGSGEERRGGGELPTPHMKQQQKEPVERHRFLLGRTPEVPVEEGTVTLRDDPPQGCLLAGTELSACG